MKCRTPDKMTQEINSPPGNCQVRTGLKGDGKYCMPTRVMDYIDVAARAEELGCRVPVGIALLPGNFPTAASTSELRYHEAAPQVRSAWRSIGLVDAGPARMTCPTTPRGPDASCRPTPLAVFFGAGLLSGPALLVTLALGAVAAVLTERPGCASSREIRFDAVVERPNRGGYACLEYYGDPCELVTLARSVREIWTDRQETDGG